MLMTVLVIEDDDSLSDLIRGKMEDCGYTTAVANSAIEAFDWLSINSPGLMILDYGLPDMNAKEFIQELKSIGKSFPFIVSTGQGDERIAVEMMKLGARDYIVKDFFFWEKLPEVVKRVERELDNEDKLKKLEYALRESEELFRHSFEYASTGGCIIDTNGKFLKINNAFTKMLGYSEVEIVKLKFSEITHPDDLHIGSGFMKQLLNGPKMWWLGILKLSKCRHNNYFKHYIYFKTEIA